MQPAGGKGADGCHVPGQGPLSTTRSGLGQTTTQPVSRPTIRGPRYAAAERLVREEFGEEMRDFLTDMRRQRFRWSDIAAIIEDKTYNVTRWAMALGCHDGEDIRVEGSPTWRGRHDRPSLDERARAHGYVDCRTLVVDWWMGGMTRRQIAAKLPCSEAALCNKFPGGFDFPYRWTEKRKEVSLRNIAAINQYGGAPENMPPIYLGKI